MKKRKHIAITIIGIVFACSCSSSVSIQSKLKGTWVLESVLSGRGGFVKVNNESKTLVFLDNDQFSFEYWSGDVGNKEHGNYYLHQNPSRKATTIVFIPDLQISGKDTVRNYMSYDIVAISDSTLQVVEQTQFIKRENSPYLVFNQQYIYKLKK